MCILGNPSLVPGVMNVEENESRKALNRHSPFLAEPAGKMFFSVASLPPNVTGNSRRVRSSKPRL